MPYTPPHVFAQQTRAKASEVNDNFDSIASYTGAIPVADLADGTSGQIIVCNSSGVPTYRTMSGEGVISNTGAFTLKQTIRAAYQTADYGLIPAGVVTGCALADLAAGSWLLITTFIVSVTSGGANPRMVLRADTNHIAAGYALIPSSNTGSALATGVCMASVTADGTTDVDLYFTGTGTSLTGVVTGANLFALKYG